MSNETKESAFPLLGNTSVQYGMSLRDYFAAKAMQGIAAKQGVWGAQHIIEIAEKSYQLADAMMKERSK